jgi:hypothetical protein
MEIGNGAIVDAKTLLVTWGPLIFQKPPLGTAPSLTASSSPKPSRPDPLDQFMLAVALVYGNSSSAGAIRTEAVLTKMNRSKLMFDFAFDLARQSEFVRSAGERELMWVLPAGRARMIELELS